MASDNDKSSNNHNLDSSVKSTKIPINSGSNGENEEKNVGVHRLGKGGRHLSIPFDSATTNGDIISCIVYEEHANMDDFFRRARPRHRPVNDDTQSDCGVLDIDEENYKTDRRGLTGYNGFSII
ncbi:unnamed protein product [Arctia plantaginis]|uniref:Uncharacterized protein n=1 Tax=Arctia plantaginis TaxID=874455 RepID=A0A8S0ZUY2_ARCPL|nr:unnamed protein product [Arctia plantaginis]CAB3242083.1 unnamed protein product [Arctia plantaginis]